MPYKTLIKPKRTYGSECWPVSKQDGNLLRIFEITISRLIYSSVNDNGVYRTRYNSELYTLYGEPDVEDTKIEVAGIPH
jgi:hypothetical protein